MTYEVEQKFPVDDMRALEAALAAMGCVPGEPAEERDCYYAHPARDFAQTDEALRIRRKGDANWITYKGPKIDATTKTRREIDLPLPPGGEAADSWADLLDALGFQPVAEVRKLRRKVIIPWQGRGVEGSLDEVDRVGRFAELELVVAPPDVEPAKACIATLAAHLGLVQTERRSYLELLLTARDSESV